MEAPSFLYKDENTLNCAEANKERGEILQTLPKGKGWMNQEILKYQGYWFNQHTILHAFPPIQNHFKARKSDIILAAFMKCGNTWLRALMFATLNRYVYDLSTHPLLNTGPHDCVPFLDTHVLSNSGIVDLEARHSPRLLASHIPYLMLSEYIGASNCKFVHIWRDPKDVLVSYWHFSSKLREKQLPKLSFEEAFELFCDGICEYGPFWDHVLGYWKASLEMPENVIVLRYENLIKEPVFYLKKLAEFMGKPFTVEEEKDGVVDGIIKLCSFENLSNLEVNKTGMLRLHDTFEINNSNFFRKGEVGDYRNHLTDEMIKRLDNITREKFNGTGLIWGL